MEHTPSNPIVSLLLICILLFIVYRILSSLNTRHKPPSAPNISNTQAPTNVVEMPVRHVQTQHPLEARLIKYTGDEDPFANDESALSSHQAIINKGGLERIGDFSIDEVPGYKLRAFTHPDRSMIGIIYKNPDRKSWLNLVTEYHDGRIITTSSAEHGIIPIDRPYGMPLFNFPGLNADQLLRRHKLEIRSNELAKPIMAEDFPEFFVKNYNKVRKHLYQIGNEPPVDFQLKQDHDVDLLNAEKSELAQANQVDFEVNFVPTVDQQKYWLSMIYKAIPVPQNKRSEFQQSLVWIVEKASPDSIIETISEFSNVKIEKVDQGRLVIKTDKGAEDIIEPGSLSGPNLFDKINSSLPAKLRFTRLPVELEEVTFYTKETLEV
ncbi:MAG TPA: hypothetical protein QF720_03835 [Nitrospinota bacterium]|nr:hypothetical protein [Nitrospinota bacterium]